MRRSTAMLAATATATATALTGYAVATLAGPSHVGRMLPWIMGRGLGLAAYAGLTALTALGLWMRHPWRARWPHPSPEVQLRLHATLAALTLVVLTGHVIALVADPWAGVPVVGAAVPGQSSYRPLAVGLGTVSVYLGLIVGASAALSGRLFGRAWLPLHRLAAAVFVTAWVHGVLAGSDTARLRPMYIATGVLVLVLAVTRRAAAPAIAVPAQP